MVTHSETAIVHIGGTACQCSSVSIGDPNEGQTITYGSPRQCVRMEGFMRDDGVFMPRKPKRQAKPGKRPYVPSKQLQRWER